MICHPAFSFLFTGFTGTGAARVVSGGWRAR